MAVESIHFFDELRVSRQEMPLLDGSGTKTMFGMHLAAWKQDKAGRHPPEDLPTLWMEPSVAVALIQALYAALAKQFPEEVARVVAEAPAAAVQRRDN